MIKFKLKSQFKNNTTTIISQFNQIWLNTLENEYNLGILKAYWLNFHKSIYITFKLPNTLPIDSNKSISSPIHLMPSLKSNILYKRQNFSCERTTCIVTLECTKPPTMPHCFSLVPLESLWWLRVQSSGFTIMFRFTTQNLYRVSNNFVIKNSIKSNFINLSRAHSW